MVTRPVVGFFEGISDLVGIRDENRRLRLEVADLERQLAETESLQRRVDELEEILAIEPPGELDTVAARVLATGPSDFDAIRLIDKGRQDGITVDMPVIDEGGLVGPGGGGHRRLGPGPADHRSHHAGGGAGGADRRDRDPHRAGRRAPCNWRCSTPTPP